MCASGCYYGHLARGQARLWLERKAVDDLLADPGVDPALARRLALVASVRAFAADLGLAVGRHYTSYVAWPGDRIVTTVVATRPREVEARGFWFPIVGRVPYKGWFDRARAEREAERLRAEGLDVCVSPVAAYSTLGWLSDPLTGPMLRADDAELVEVVLHELVHATVYVAGDADLSESAATFVGQEGAIAYLARRGLAGDARPPAELAARRAERTRERRALARALLALRDEVGALYAALPPDAPADLVATRRRALEVAARERIAQDVYGGGEAGRAAAAPLRLGDACLALRGTYAAALPLHEATFHALGDDLRAFVARLVEAARAPDPRAALFGDANALARPRD